MNIQIKSYSGVYVLETQQLLKSSMAEIWEYFATPQNLQSITPSDINFKITSGLAGAIYPGKIITYDLSIIPPLTTKWITEITHVVDQKYFIDEQRCGPYALWHHEHHFSPQGEKVLMTDLVTYKLPLGWVGRQVAGRLVAQKLKSIFTFRYEKLNNLFNG